MNGLTIFLIVFGICLFGAYGIPLILAARGCRHARYECQGKAYEFVTYFPIYFKDFRHAETKGSTVTLTIEMADGLRRYPGEVLELTFDLVTDQMTRRTLAYYYPDITPGRFQVYYDDHFHLFCGYYIDPI